MEKKEEHPLKGLYLVRVYNEDVSPFDVVTDLIREEAVMLCEKVAPYRCVDKDHDQLAYMTKREEVEDWARGIAEVKGVDIKSPNPVYFVLTDNPTTEEHEGPGRKVFCLPANEVDLSSVTFMYDDSFVNYAVEIENDKRLHPLNGKVLTAEEMGTTIKEHYVLGGYKSGERYIEAQVWSRSLDQKEHARSALSSQVSSADIVSKQTL